MIEYDATVFAWDLSDVERVCDRLSRHSYTDASRVADEAVEDEHASFVL